MQLLEPFGEVQRYTSMFIGKYKLTGLKYGYLSPKSRYQSMNTLIKRYMRGILANSQAPTYEFFVLGYITLDVVSDN